MPCSPHLAGALSALVRAWVPGPRLLAGRRNARPPLRLRPLPCRLPARRTGGWTPCCRCVQRGCHSHMSHKHLYKALLHRHGQACTSAYMHDLMGAPKTVTLMHGVSFAWVAGSGAGRRREMDNISSQDPWWPCNAQRRAKSCMHPQSVCLRGCTWMGGLIGTCCFAYRYHIIHLFSCMRVRMHKGCGFGLPCSQPKCTNAYMCTRTCTPACTATVLACRRPGRRLAAMRPHR